ncbi:hypothetical protein MAR_013287 [Mya arenaria]|uniref:G-protein coupled receptors family 1 profile domain-containing protein n=1 Tax=Mya arenaria TaxID=6604 RepID=A0ABY7FZF0_MYAAR|nr:hypothetical protein MAR_013287 [Mya arenaria]
MASNNTTQTAMVLLKDGYDIPVHGLTNGMFYYIQVPAIVCITVSLLCGLVTIISSFRSHEPGKFYTRWTKGERLIVYMSSCDVLFNTSHLMDHLQLLITKTHVRPKELCTFYGFIMTIFVVAQILIVNVVAINVFTMMFFNINISFGKFDGGLLLWAFGVPFIGSFIAAICFFDAINGKVAQLVLITIPITVIMAVNVLFYILTFIKIRTEVRAMKQSLGNMASTAVLPAKCPCSLWPFLSNGFALLLLGAWSMFVDNPADVPEFLNYIGVISTNLGGVLNFIVYLRVFKNTRPNMTTNKASRVPHPASAPRTSDKNTSSTKEYAFN